MPNICRFCVFECAGTDMCDKGQKSKKTRQHEHKIWKELEKPESGKEFTTLDHH